MEKEGNFFIKYVSPPLHSSSCVSRPDDLNDEVVEWKERMKYFYEDFDWLLRLPDALFWRQITHDETFSTSFDSFLQFCPRPYDVQAVPRQCKEIQEEIKKAMLLLVIRICDDNSIDGFTDQSYGSVLYDNYLLDIPKIIDICSIYSGVHSSTRNLLSNALSNVFMKQPEYWNDLDMAIDTLFKTFDSMAARFCLTNDKTEDTPKQLQSEDQDEKPSSNDVFDILVYLYDTANSLLAFLKICKHTNRSFFDKEALQRFASLVDKLLPHLKELSKLEWKPEVQMYFKRSRKCFLHVCHMILQNCFFDEGGTSLTSICDQRICEEYLNVVSLLLAESRFIIYYEKYYKLSEELKRIDLRNLSGHEDTIQYIQQIIGSLHPNLGQENAATSPEEQGATASLSNDMIQSIVMQVKNMLPDENDSFLQACIVHYNGDSQNVINSILEDNIPPFLQEIRHVGQTAIGCEHRTTGKSYPERGIKNRASLPVDGNDGRLAGHYYRKTDRMSKTEEDEIFHSEGSSNFFTEFLNRYEQSEMNDDVTNSHLHDEYDDEYDDTYDSHNVGAMDADSGDELKDLTSRRSFVKPKVLAALERRDESSENENSSSETGSDMEREEIQPDEMTFGGPSANGRGGRGGRFRGQARGGARARGSSRGKTRGTRGGQAREGERRKDIKEQGPDRGRTDRGYGGRGRGGRGGKHNQKSLAMKKSALCSLNLLCCFQKFVV